MMELKLQENEISYIVLYLGASVEKLKQINVAVVCYTGYSNSRFLIAKSESIFYQKINIYILGPYSSLNTAKIIEKILTL